MRKSTKLMKILKWKHGIETAVADSNRNLGCCRSCTASELATTAEELEIEGKPYAFIFSREPEFENRWMRIDFGTEGDNDAHGWVIVKEALELGLIVKWNGNSSTTIQIREHQI